LANVKLEYTNPKSCNLNLRGGGGRPPALTQIMGTSHLLLMEKKSGKIYNSLILTMKERNHTTVEKFDFNKGIY
jgi:hypothetical protein